MHYRIEAEGLKELRRDLRKVEQASPRAVSAAVRAAGQAPLRRVRELTPKVKGTLAGGWRLSAAGPVGALTNRVPYAGGAVWGQRGRWKGFDRYGPPPRFAGPAIEQTAGQIEAELTKQLAPLLSLYSGFHG